MSDLELAQAEAVLEGLGATEIFLKCWSGPWARICGYPLVGIPGKVWCPRCGKEYPGVILDADGVVEVKYFNWSRQP